MSNGPQLMTVIEFKHIRNGECIYSEEMIPNIWHKEGHEFVLAALFDTDYGVSIPENYYLGLDNRTTLAATDTLLTLSGEPVGQGYARVPMSSEEGFVVGELNGRIRAKSGIATFTATSGTWVPIRNIFLSTSLNNSGWLISSSAIGGVRTLAPGESFTAQVALALARAS